MAHIGQRVRQHPLQELQRRPSGEHEAEHQRHQYQVELAQPPHAPVHAQDHGDDGDQGNHQHHQDLHADGVRHPEEVAEPGGNLLGAEAEGSRQPKEGGEDRQDVNDMPGPAPGALPQEGMEGGAHRQRQPIVEGEDRQRQANNGVDAPGMEAPVEEGAGHAQAAALGEAGRLHAEGRRQRVGHRLQDAIEHQAYADAGGEHHRKPAAQPIVGPRVLAANADAAHRQERNDQAEDQEDIGGQHEQPVQLGGGPHPHRQEDPGRGLGRRQRQRHKERHDGRRHHKHRIVDIQPKGLNVPVLVGAGRIAPQLPLVCVRQSAS